MKHILTIVSMVFASNSYAFTTRDTFKCANNDTVVITASMTPGSGGSFKPVAKAHSEKYGVLAQRDCSQIASKWKSYGSENCYANENVLFSHFDQLGKMTIIHKQQIYFTICHLVDSVQ